MSPSITNVITIIPTLIPSITPTAVPTLQPIIVQVTSPPNHIGFTDIAALFGSFGTIVSLGLLIFEIYKYRNDKGIIKIRIGFDISLIGKTTSGQIITNDRSIKKFWTIDIANTGKKDVIITQMSFQDKKNENMNYVVMRDYYHDFHSITVKPNDSYSYTFPYDMHNPNDLKMVYLMDATGKVYKERINCNDKWKPSVKIK